MMIHYWLLKKTFATSFGPPVAAEAARFFLICVSLSHIRILTHSQLKCWDWRIKHIIADDFSHDGYLCHLPTIVNASQESNKVPSSRLHDLTVFISQWLLPSIGRSPRKPPISTLRHLKPERLKSSWSRQHLTPHISVSSQAGHMRSLVYVWFFWVLLQGFSSTSIWIGNAFFVILIIVGSTSPF